MQKTEDNNYKLVQIDIYKANSILLLLIIPVSAIFILPFYLLWQDALPANAEELLLFLKSFVNTKLILFLIYLIMGIVLHELIHGAIWALFAKRGWKSIKFGFLWQYLTPYCHCYDELKMKYYLLGALSPAIILGFIPAILSLFIGNVSLLLLGIFFILTAVGDILISIELFKESFDDVVMDHPDLPGCYIKKMN